MLTLSGDSKVAERVTQRAAKVDVRVPNAFGLSAIESCSGATDTCKKVCYALRAELRPSTKNAMARNLATLLAYGDDVDAMAAELCAMVEQFKAKADRAGIDEAIFRIHWDGDFYSVAYAAAWAKVIELFPTVQFWAYTRSFQAWCNVVPVLAGLPNLSLYLSVDVDNHKRAAAVHKRHPWTRLAVMAETSVHIDLIRAAIKVGPAPICPELTGKLPLVVSNDRRHRLAVGEKGQGACSACRLCPNGTADVGFPTSRKG